VETFGVAFYGIFHMGFFTQQQITQFELSKLKGGVRGGITNGQPLERPLYCSNPTLRKRFPTVGL
jgi:chorismate synthase